MPRSAWRVGVDEGEIQMAEDEQEANKRGRVPWTTVRAVPTKAALSCGKPQENAGHREQQCERGGDDHVQLLTRVEAPLGRSASDEPAAVVRASIL